MRASTITPFPVLRPARPVLASRSLVATVATAALLAISGCASGAPATQAEAVTANDVWVRATDEDMSAAFGTLSSTIEAALVGASTDVAGVVELHETAGGTMRPIAEIPIAEGGTATLEPGGDHIMLMELERALEPGDELEIELEFADGSTQRIDAVVREAAAGDEDYDHGGH